MAPTGHEATGIYNPFRQGTRVYLTLPDGRRVGFTFTPQKHELPGVTYYTPAYRPTPASAGRSTSAAGRCCAAATGFYDLETGRPYNPASGQFEGPEYTLTAPDGTVYHLSSSRGVEEQILPGGERLIYSDSGITSSTGDRVPFVRDAAGRLVEIDAPDGTRVVYGYDAQGNLTSTYHTASGQGSRYGYAINDAHLLTLATTPRQRRRERHSIRHNGGGVAARRRPGQCPASTAAAPHPARSPRAPRDATPSRSFRPKRNRRVTALFCSGSKFKRRQAASSRRVPHFAGLTPLLQRTQRRATLLPCSP